MRKVHVEDAVGLTLGHDITKIVPGREKYRAFCRGHIVRAEDIPRLKDMGKEHIFVWEPDDNMVHEDEAALRMAQAAAGPGVSFAKPSQGRVNLKASFDGLLQVQVAQLNWINNLENVIFSTLHNNRVVAQNQVIAGTRVVPVAIENSILEEAVRLGREPGPLLTVKPFRPLWVAVVTTGSEINSGRIKDGFGKTMRHKINPFGGRWMGQTIVPDDPQLITREIQNFIAEGADLILVTGGMSVDADDATPNGIRSSGAEVVFYGAPVLPGSQFMLAYQGHIPIIGVPGGVLFNSVTTLDLLLPRLFVGDVITRADIVALGHGGLCEECPICYYPACPFGKATPL
ncbi:MAG TPA: molybdopterin-binding protein [Syntrophomonadaceae bacterium]|nr:molybdopterin-binding protein [Syntrophomonadaceae bacterium]